MSSTGRVLVTGAAGFIGSSVVDRLLTLGWEVIGLDSYDDFYPTVLKDRNLQHARQVDGFSEIRGDIRDAAVLDALPPGIEYVVHLAARAGVRPSIDQPVLYSDVNVQGTAELLEWMHRGRIRRLIFASSSSVYGNNEKVPFSEADPVENPISPYAATKRAGELLCHTYHHLFALSVVCLRFFTVYGPRQRPDLAIRKFARLMRDGEKIPFYGDGTTERDYTYVEDIVDGVVGALSLVQSGSAMYEIINLGENRTISLATMVSTLANAMNVTPRLERLPLQPGDVLRTFADISKAQRLLGYSPTMEFEDGMERFLEWFDRNGGEC